MGLFDFLTRRREQESAIPPSETEVGPSLPSFAASGDQVVGEQVAGAEATTLTGVDTLASIGGLEGLGALVQQAAAQGNIEVTQSSIDLRGSGLREEIVGIMRQHGIDPESGSGASVDASAYGHMQQQMLEALQRHGLDLGGPGGASIQIENREGD